MQEQEAGRQGSVVSCCACLCSGVCAAAHTDRHTLTTKEVVSAVQRTSCWISSVVSATCCSKSSRHSLKSCTAAVEQWTQHTDSSSSSIQVGTCSILQQPAAPISRAPPACGVCSTVRLSAVMLSEARCTKDRSSPANDVMLASSRDREEDMAEEGSVLKMGVLLVAKARGQPLAECRARGMWNRVWQV